MNTIYIFDMRILFQMSKIILATLKVICKYYVLVRQTETFTDLEEKTTQSSSWSHGCWQGIQALGDCVPGPPVSPTETYSRHPCGAWPSASPSSSRLVTTFCLF